jgi:hypothetical protein
VHASQSYSPYLRRHPCLQADRAGLSKLNSVRKSNVEVDVLLGESDSPTAEAIKGSDAYRNEIPDSLERR